MTRTEPGCWCKEPIGTLTAIGAVVGLTCELGAVVVTAWLFGSHPSLEHLALVLLAFAIPPNYVFKRPLHEGTP